MKFGGKHLAVGIGLLVLLAALSLLHPRVQDQIFIRGAKGVFAKRVKTESLLADDALQVLICGSSAPLPDLKRAKSCTIVIAGSRFFVVDTGPESAEVAGSWLFPMSRISGVLLTHMHSDHIADLGEWNLATWFAGRDSNLPVYGPPGVERVVRGFEEAYAQDVIFRNRHHSDGFMPLENSGMTAHAVSMAGADLGRKDRQQVVLEASGLKITAFEVNHNVVEPAYGYRFDYRGRSVVISGDTAPHPPLVQMAKGVDVLLHEADARHLYALIDRAGAQSQGVDRINQLNREIHDYHSSPLEAAELANAAGVKQLVFTHLMPPIMFAAQLPLWKRGLKRVRPTGTTVSTDGTWIRLPANSASVHVGHIKELW